MQTLENNRTQVARKDNAQLGDSRELGLGPCVSCWAAGIVLLLLALWFFAEYSPGTEFGCSVNSVMPVLTNNMVLLVGVVLALSLGFLCFRRPGERLTGLSVLAFSVLILWYCWALRYTGGNLSDRVGFAGRWLRLTTSEEHSFPVVGTILLLILTGPWLWHDVRLAGSRSSGSETLCAREGANRDKFCCRTEMTVISLLVVSASSLGWAAWRPDSRWNVPGAFALPLFTAYYLAVAAGRASVYFHSLAIFGVLTGTLCFGWAVAFSWKAVAALTFMVSIAFYTCFLADFFFWQRTRIPALCPFVWFLLLLGAESLPLGSFFLSAGLLYPSAFSLLPYTSLNGLTLLFFLIPSLGLFYLGYCFNRKHPGAISLWKPRVLAMTSVSLVLSLSGVAWSALTVEPPRSPDARTA